MSASDTLTRQVGPLPVWGWGVAVVGGIALGVAIKRAMGHGAESTGEPTVVPAPYLGPIGDAAVTLRPAPPEPAGEKFTTNDEWGTAAVKYLVASGSATGWRAAQVVQRFLEGAYLEPDDRTLIDKAIAALGPPPMGSPIMQEPTPGADVPTSPVPQTPAPSAPTVPLPAGFSQWLGGVLDPGVSPAARQSHDQAVGDPSRSVTAPAAYDPSIYSAGLGSLPVAPGSVEQTVSYNGSPSMRVITQPDGSQIWTA